MKEKTMSNDDILKLVMTTEWSKDEVVKLLHISDVLLKKTNTANTKRLKRIPDDPCRHGIHYEHCCIEHGCKYGDNNCPIWVGKQRQARPCQDCSTTDIFSHPIIPPIEELQERNLNDVDNDQEE
jgi:hypothetical protein